MPNEDVQVYAKWTPATDTKYTVEHYKQELNGAYACGEQTRCRAPPKPR